MALLRYFRSASLPNILVTAKEVVLDRLIENFNVLQFAGEGVMPRKILLDQIVFADGLYCLVRDKIDSEVLNAAKHLRIVSTMSVGVDHIDLNECAKRNIAVSNTPGVLTEATAETTVSLLLATARRIPEAIDEAKSGRWGTWSPFYMCGIGVSDSVVGIIGLGRIGLSVAEKLNAFHPSRILYHNRKPNNEKAAKVGAVYVTLDELLQKSDFVLVTCAASEENKGMICRKTLSLMKESAILINTSRGSLVNQKDLYDALVNGKIRAAGLDVTVPEPLPPTDPLFKLSNCVILPHIGSATDRSRTAMMRMAEDAILKELSGVLVSHEFF